MHIENPHVDVTTTEHKYIKSIVNVVVCLLGIFGIRQRNALFYITIQMVFPMSYRISHKYGVWLYACYI